MFSRQCLPGDHESFLTEHAIYLGRTNTSTVSFFVLEGTATNGVFTNIYNASVSAVAGSGYDGRASTKGDIDVVAGEVGGGLGLGLHAP